ncbi:MAG TPA: hypothetical protein VFF62_00875 [Candidatus Nitrosocosmicus sp.]|nr:hypothetical protein [Candidatus Nitrosocosmicus sp.]
MKFFVIAGSLVIVLGWGEVAFAQQKVADPGQSPGAPIAPAPPPAEEGLAIIAPAPSVRESTRVRESEFYPGEDVRVRHEPAFIQGVSKAPAKGPIRRYGLSGWTSPSGRGDSQAVQENGWFSFGFSIVWE